MGSFEIEISTRSNDVVTALKSRTDAEVTTEKNMTGETIVLLSVVVPLATVVIKEVGKFARERQVSIRSQKLKVGKGTMTFDGFSVEEVCEIVDKLRERDAE